MNKVERAVHSMLQKKPFYAHFFLNCKVEYNTRNIPTAAVMLNQNGITMVFNSDFLEKQTPENIGAIVEHETLHLLFDHVYAYKANPALNKFVANIAMDCAINQYIDSLPEGSITLDSIQKAIKKELRPEETWEYYYAQIQNYADKMKAKGIKPLDDHNGFDSAPDSLEKAILRSAVESATKASAGNVPNAVLKVLDKMRESAQVPWKTILSNFVARYSSSEKRATRKKSNRRFGINVPGVLKKRELVLGVCVDSSGSISDEAFELFMAEISRVTKYCKTVHLIDADCVVQDIQTIKKNKKPELKRSGYGGTAYQPAIDACMQLKCDAIVYFGDFDTADKPQNPGVPFLWVGVGSSPKPGDFGHETRIAV